MSDIEAIQKTIRTYLDAGRSGDATQMKPVFFENATMYTVKDGALEGGAIDNLFKGVEQIGPAPDLIDRVGDIDLNRDTATVRIDLENWVGAQFTDQLCLMKVAGTWKILHKVFVQH